MSYTIISEIDEIVSDKQSLSRGVNDNMNTNGFGNNINSSMQAAREMIESIPVQAIQRRFQTPQRQSPPSFDNQFNQYPTKSLRRNNQHASLFEKTPIMTIMNEETTQIKTKEKIKHKKDDDDDDEEEEEDKKLKKTIKMVEEMNTKFIHNLNVMNDNILMLYKKIHAQDMMLKAILFVLIIVLVLVLRK